MIIFLSELRDSRLFDLLDPLSRTKLEGLENSQVIEQIEYFMKLCKPAKVTVLGEDEEDIRYVRDLALRSGEEMPLKIEGQTVHFDGYYDLARDVGVTKVLTTPNMRMSKRINTIDREEGLKEILNLLDGAMIGKECLVKFYSLGPTNSRFSLCAMQITDSPYVAHSEDILYRQGYNQFKRLKGSGEFFTFIHSAGELDDKRATKNVHLRRIYIDIVDGKVYSANNQYAGNSVGLKKLALRLAIHRANHEDWLAEHMLIMGVYPPGKGRVTYFTGAFPSACGKTSTAMIPGQRIVGDDIAYLRVDDEGYARAVNIEQGIFGIIQDVNPIDDPLIYKALTTPRELIFSNVLVADGVPFWLGMGRDDIPERGVNYSGEWWKGKRDDKGDEIPYAHGNARYTMRLSELENVDPNYNDPKGVVVRGILYGGRDSDTNVPIAEALSWEHGVYMGATLESETTTATIGRVGVRRCDPMANIDFVVVPLGLYVSNHISFGRRLKHKPKVFAVNYFLKHEGRYTNSKVDKKVWILWAEGRIHGDYEAVETPIGCIPLYEDLEKLFIEALGKEYPWEDYRIQFSVRLERQLEKIERMENFFKDEEMPEEFWRVLKKQREELMRLKLETGRESLPPSFFQTV
ncbi:MAG: phosphoenolpyruvate carboxykinase (GTP) [Candidatus Bathyarchaeia archaeon]